MSETVVGAVAAVWGFVMALSPALQIRHMLRTGSSTDVSIGYFMLLIPGFLLWVAYGAVTDDPFLAVPNAVAAVTALILIACALRLRHRARPLDDRRRPKRG